MFTPLFRALAASLCALLPSAASMAQPALATHTLRALDAKAPVAPLRHVSVLPRPASSPANPLPWREANRQVDAIGGWKAYAREAAATAAPAAAPPASAAGATP